MMALRVVLLGGASFLPFLRFSSLEFRGKALLGSAMPDARYTGGPFNS